MKVRIVSVDNQYVTPQVVVQCVSPASGRFTIPAIGDVSWWGARIGQIVVLVAMDAEPA